MASFRFGRSTESFSSRSQDGSELALQLSLIEEERGRWEGTQRRQVTGDELDESYFLREVIGSGAFGTVYRAIRRADSQAMAIK